MEQSEGRLGEYVVGRGLGMNQRIGMGVACGLHRAVCVAAVVVQLAGGSWGAEVGEGREEFV